MVNMSLTGEENKVLHKVALTIQLLRNVHPTMSAQTAHTFLLCVLNEGASLSEIVRMSGFKLPTVSRIILDLGLRNRKREPGLGLLVTTTDPHELRKKVIKLTDKGHTLVRQILAVMKT
jgi:DNA-binding MarR family transcriptional regulator